MIDYENEIFDSVAKAFRAKHPKIQIYSDTVARPAKLPCVVLVQIANTTVSDTLDSSGTENHVDLQWQVDVYSNKSSGRRQECRELLADIDAEMLANGCRRILMYNTPNPNDDTIYRVTARYMVRIAADGKRYRR